ncbi:DUF1465 family protein [Bartonella sp. DGB2]|uniref:DUF1465 family protein n=1 Tax=Bartonella sp. DGB2 TaxID=3388426 RepID=UPI00398FEF80
MPQKRKSNEHKVVIKESLFDKAFNRLYQQAMHLIEETAAYVDGAGKDASLMLAAPVANLYARETMYLSARLMQLAAWFILERAAKEQEMKPSQISKEREKIRLQTPAFHCDSPHWPALPTKFHALVEATRALEERVALIEKKRSGEHEHPLVSQWQRLQHVFCARPKG